MELQLHQREKEGIQILDLHGHLIEGASEARLRAGLGALVFCDARLTRASGALRLLNVSPRHLDLLVLTKLGTISEVFTDEQDAINSFFPDRAALRYDILEFIEDPDRGSVAKPCE